uniref:Uncharacterized protein n=1 Tax=Meloidogyne javanica TaxID=6303 RepID=A0A915MXX7_MELJA
MKDFESSKPEMIDLTCTTAIYEKEINFYELDFANISKKPSCILLDNSGLSGTRSKVSHSDQTLNGCKSYTNSENTEENKIEQIFEQNKDSNGDAKEDKIRNHLRDIYVKAKRRNHRLMASAAADEVNYEFDLNVISERMAERYFNLFNKETIDLDPCQVDRKNECTKVNKKRTGINETSPNKKINLFPGSECHKGKGKQSDLISKYSETNIGGNHESNINEDDEFFTLLDFLDDSHDEHARAQVSNRDTLVQAPNYFIGESQFNDNSNGNESNSLLSNNEFFVNKADELAKNDLSFWNDEEPQDMRKNM